MRSLKLIGLGVLIWGLSLLWPDINQVLRLPVMISLSIGLGAISLAYVLVQRFHRPPHDKSSGQDQPSRPIPVIAAR
jgi:hypothetical protein